VQSELVLHIGCAGEPNTPNTCEESIAATNFALSAAYAGTGSVVVDGL